MLGHLRAQVKPHLILGGLLLAAAAARLAIALAGDAAVIALCIAVAAMVATLVTAMMRRRERGGIAAARFLIAAVSGCVWLTWTALAGITTTAVAVLLAVGWGMSFGYWRRNRIPIPPEKQPMPVPTEATKLRLWDNNIARNGGPLPGSRLSGEDITDTDAGLRRRYDGHLVPGQQSLATAKAAMTNLRTGLRLKPKQDLILEVHPDMDESVIQVTIVEESSILDADHIPWPGSTFDPATGTVALGPYIDGDGVARWVMLADNGLYGGYLCGVTRSGKSVMLESLALAAASAGLVVWFADPQGGASSPWLAERADHKALSVDQIKQMLRDALALKNLRQAENAYYKLSGFQQSPERPGLLIFIDECHKPFADPEIQAMATELAREGAKVGMNIIAASQVATLDAFGTGAGADALRSSLTAGNLVILRAKSNNTKNVLPGVDVDPTAFPRIAGYAYLVDDTGKRRTAPLRGYFLSPQARQAWDQQVTWEPLDEGGSRAIGDRYINRHAIAETNREKLGAIIAAARGGNPINLAELHATKPKPAVTSKPAENEEARVIQFPHLHAAPATGSGDQTPTRATAVDVVYGLICNGVTRTGDLQTRSGYAEGSVRRAINILETKGKVRKDKHGVWVKAS